MALIEPIGTKVAISGFSIYGIKGTGNNKKSIVFLLKGGSKQNVRTGASADIQGLINSAIREYSYVEVWSADSKKVEEVAAKLCVPKSIKYLNQHDGVLIVYSGASGQIVKSLKKAGVEKIFFRAQNPELFHRLSYFLISKNPKYLGIAVQGFVSDCRVVRYSDIVIPISERDSRLYFKLIKFLIRGEGKIKHLTYQVITSNFTLRKKYLPYFLVGSSTKSTLVSSVDRSLVRNLKRNRAYANNLAGIGFGLQPIEEYLHRNYGFQKDVNLYIRYCPVVIIPTTKGWGFKTKILDFLNEGKIVVVHRLLAKKIDSEIRQNLHVINKWGDLQVLNLDSLKRSNSNLLNTNSSLLNLIES
jgi:hypothetical protein